MTRLLPLVLAAAALLALLPVARAEESGITVSNAWARATPGKAPTGAAYFTITNSGAAADRLTGASTPVADRAELHESTEENGVMKMRPVGPVALAPGQTVTLNPGGYHLMLVGLKQPLKQGTSFPLTLTFEKAGKKEVQVAVQRAGAMSGGMSGQEMKDMGGMKK